MLYYLLWEHVNGTNSPPKQQLNTKTNNTVKGHLTSASCWKLFEELETVSVIFIKSEVIKMIQRVGVILFNL